MRDLREFENYRIALERYGTAYGAPGNPYGGAFIFPSVVDGQDLRVIASSGGGWDHVSISRAKRCPNWLEMEQVANLLFKPDEYAYQLHVPREKHINLHPYTLHWWRSHKYPIHVPPSYFVAVPGTLEDNRRYLDEQLAKGG